MGKEVKEEKPRREKSADIVSRDYTIHMSKRLYGVSFKNRAPRAIREIKQFATKAMNTRWAITLISMIDQIFIIFFMKF